jgi:hypothetical protein
MSCAPSHETNEISHETNEIAHVCELVATAFFCFGYAYFGEVAPVLWLPRSTGPSVLGVLWLGWNVVTPRESVVTDPPFGGS